MDRPLIEELEKDHTPKHAYNSMVVCPHEWKKLLAYIRHLEAAIKEWEVGDPGRRGAYINRAFKTLRAIAAHIPQLKG